ncbi:hypothetical protein COCMIDRAFT_36282 [Bipolaris oryzae ATCC 44560]|uniref:Extracellular membrane protein CFEM domain-containing protein n=1 Tax=Bipolaris oryzae ATCC 44560 TaxID=930090 RepID=W6Z8G3_COCMI|nr:uncharacterized protein COCMIDRAFT_36282 [Bipolaris oryzae ATCC 44560]EUC46083.1 hypothetical protein COCMIDRAFT_36282 [Bipolaris oryzae ATCC 44560]
MRVSTILFASLAIARAEIVLQDIPLHPTELVSNEEPSSLTPLDAQHDWVYPETLPPMPQCIAEQDQAAWLSAMTKCTKKQCMRHFGVICSRHQWRTQLSCLNTEMSPQFLEQYIDYCSRSVLKKAQLYQWIRTATDRTWLVEVGDANGLQRLSPGSLTKGYATIRVIDKAPACLTQSVSASSMEPFGQVMASCGFEASTRHTGNAKRPWEYHERQHTMVALDAEIAGYDLTHAIIPDNDYFDKQCFCKTFDASLAEGNCAGPGVDSTRQRLWMHATCGSASLPPNWREGLKTTPHDYIPTERWKWPQCFNSMPDSVVRLQDQCTTNACRVGFDGYCYVQRAVERSCFCRNISYGTCKGSCHVFENRIDYVRWLHDLCGAEEGWHGLPEDWHQLASVSRRDAIPWTWYKDSFSLSNDSTGETNPSSPNQTCESREWKQMSLLFINLAALFTAVFGPKPSSNPTTNPLTSILWFPRGIAVAALYLLSNALNAMLIQSTPSYSETPMVELALLWCTIPRLTWLTILLVLASPYNRSTFSAVATAIVSETLLQALSASTMLSTVSYGFTHRFYAPNTPVLHNLPAANYMYTGALMWTIAMFLSILSFFYILFDPSTLHRSPARWRNTRNAHLATSLKQPSAQCWTWIEQKIAEYWIDRDWDSAFEHTPLVQSEGYVHAVYGALPAKTYRGRSTKRRVVRATLVAGVSMVLLWIAQWVFWVGFVGVVEDEFCTPQLGLSTLTWVVSSMAAVVGVVKS